MEKVLKSQVKKNLNLQEDYKCIKCRDMTFILDGDTATACECRKLREAERILEISGISDEFRKKIFDNFDYSVSRDVLNAYVRAKTYAKDFDYISDSRHNSIAFMGSSGSGKTHLSLAISNYLMDSGVGVLYMSYRDSIVSIKQSIMDSENYNRIMSRYKNAKVLLIDDLFKGRITDSDVNIMFEIINYRYFNNKPMIISTELSKEKLIGIDEAIGSRILEMCKDYSVELCGKELNYRING